MKHAKMLLSDLPSKDSVMGIAIIGDNNKIEKLIVNPRVLVDFGTLGIKRGIKGEHKNVRLSKEEFHHKDLMKTVAEMATKFGCETNLTID
jgi:hypothetical protein